MNSKSVLSKIMTLLSLENEVNFTDAQTKDGTILQSPTFDVGEDVEVVAEDGSKTPAPDGEHEIALKDSEGNEVIIKVITKDGKIVERENVELVDEEVVDKEAEIEDESDIEIEMADATTETAEGLPNTTEESKANEVKEGEPMGDPIISLGYRIDEMEKIISKMKEKMESAYPEEGQPEVSSLDPTQLAAEEEEEELPKLDGAPLETKLSADHLHTPNNYGKKVGSPQGSFLSKLYR
jgi:hypothetical protein